MARKKTAVGRGWGVGVEKGRKKKRNASRQTAVKQEKFSSLFPLASSPLLFFFSRYLFSSSPVTETPAGLAS